MDTIVSYSTQEVIDFIRQFHDYDTGEVTQTFRSGMCYWFAYILRGRFPGAEIVYEPVEGHFMAQIGGRLFDIRGDVTDLYLEEPTEMYSEEFCWEIPSIVDGAILKTR